MSARYTFRNKTTRVEHERVRYVCPLRWPELTAEACPVNHKLDREGQAYKDVYQQRTATERINSQAVALGIERPRLRNGAAIARLNTLIYILINPSTSLRAGSARPAAHPPTPGQRW